MIVVDSDEWRMSAVTKQWQRIITGGSPEITHQDIQNPDYLLADKVGVERATINDLVQKMKAKSFEGQLQRVIEKGYQPVALIEGLVPSHSEILLESVYGYISSLSESGITVIHTTTPEHTAKHLLKLHEKVMKNEFKTLFVPTIRSNTDHPTIQKLMGIDGVDEKTAEKIKLKYSNVLSFTWDCYKHLNGKLSKLITIEGIAERSATKIARDWIRSWKK